jgi:hypothetical protein
MSTTALTTTTQRNAGQAASGRGRRSEKRNAQGVVTARLLPEDRAHLEAMARAASMGICSYAGQVLAAHASGTDRTPRLLYDADSDALRAVRRLAEFVGEVGGSLRQAIGHAVEAGYGDAADEFSDALIDLRAEHARLTDLISRLEGVYRVAPRQGW